MKYFFLFVGAVFLVAVLYVNSIPRQAATPFGHFKGAGDPVAESDWAPVTPVSQAPEHDSPAGYSTYEARSAILTAHNKPFWSTPYWVSSISEALAVTANVPYRITQAGYKKSLPLETLNQGYGDCVDHSALLYQMMHDAGLDRELEMRWGWVKWDLTGGVDYHSWVRYHNVDYDPNEVNGEVKFTVRELGSVFTTYEEVVNVVNEWRGDITKGRN